MSDKSRTLFAALRQAHFSTMAISTCAAGVLLAVIAFVTLRSQVHENLGLVARSIAYSSEAALVFGDRTVAGEILNQIAVREHLLEARIQTADGSVFVAYEPPEEAAINRFFEKMVRTFFSDPVHAEIVYDHRVIGEVVLRGNGTVFINFFSRIMLATLACLVLAIWLAGRVAHRTERHIVDNLDAFAALTRSVRLNNDFDRRLPSFNVKEFDELGKDFNALLSELAANRTELVSRQEMLEEANASLSHLALHDSLTGLANRAHFNDRLNHAIRHARAEHIRMGVLYLDNDHFKQVNDLFGHTAGDALLIAVAGRIRGAIRETDLVARLGGDEFAVLLPLLSAPEDAGTVAQKILTAMSVPVKISENEVVVPGISIGVALFPEHGESSDELLRAADDAMYLAKNSGRGCYRMVDEGASAEGRSNTKR